MKGIAAVIVFAFVAMAAIVVTEGVIVTNYLVRADNIVRVLKEEEVISSVNNMEYAKRGLSEAVTYSLNQASYDIGRRGGYFNPPSETSLDCIPYWNVFGKSYAPDFKGELQANLLRIFNAYGTSLGIDVPKYDTVTFDQKDSELNLTSSGKLTDQEDFFTVRDSANFVQSADLRIFKLYSAASDIESQLDSGVSSANSYSNALDTIQSVSSSSSQKYSTQGIQVSIQPSQNLDNSGNNFAVKILVSLTDSSKQNLVYDFNDKKLEMKSDVFTYYLLLGKSNMTLETNDCGKIAY